jgi:O-antigen/teichoic acid export membrane protein
MLAIIKVRIFGTGGLRAELAKGAIGSFGLKLINALLNLALSVVLARTLAPEGYGIYAFAFSAMTLLAVPVQLGLPTLLIREVARYHLESRWDLLRGILKRANQTVFILSLVVGSTAGGIAWLFADRWDFTQLATFGWSLLLLPLIALNRLREAALQGLRRVVMGQIPEKVLQPVILLILVGSTSLADSLAPPLAMALYCTAAMLSFLVGTVMLLRALPTEVRAVQPRYDGSTWMSSVLPLSLLAGLQVINGQTDIFMLGLLTTKVDVGC